MCYKIFIITAMMVKMMTQARIRLSIRLMIDFWLEFGQSKWTLVHRKFNIDFLSIFWLIKFQSQF